MARSPIKSAARVLEVLELFADSRTPLRQKAVVERLAYPQSSTTGLLKSLVALGYLNYHRATRTYFPTTRVAAVGDWINHTIFGSGALMAMMRRIQAETDETVALVSQNDLYVQYLRVLVPAHPHTYPVPEGGMRLLTQSSAGLVLLSRMPDRTVARLVRHIDIQARGTAPRTDVARLLDQLAWIRAHGHCFLSGIPFAEAATISLPMPDAPHGIPLAIGVGGARERIARDRTRILAVIEAAVAAYRAAPVGAEGGEPEEAGKSHV
jgi:DNA-binding IclR family transcriptional regulator